MVKGTPADRLEQSSTLADAIEVEFSDRTAKIPSCYYEFARRYPLPSGELFQGFVFVRFGGRGTPIAALMAPYADEMTAYRLADMRRIGAVDSRRVAVNWKTAIDDFRQGYEVSLAHPGLSRLFGGAYETEVAEHGIARSIGRLRDKEGWSYGAGSRITDAVGQGTFRAGGGVQTDKTAESMVEVRKELQDIIGARKPDAAELKFAKDSIAIALPGNNETSNEIADSYAEILTYGLKDSYWKRIE